MTDTGTNNNTGGRYRPRWLWIGLVVSIALNLLVIGTVAGAFWKLNKKNSSLRGGFNRSIVLFVRQLPEARQAEIRPLIRNVRKKIRPLRRSLRRQRREHTDLLTQEPFDKARFQASIERLLASETKVRRAVRLPLVELLAKLTPAERRKLIAMHRKRIKELRKMRRARWRNR